MNSARLEWISGAPKYKKGNWNARYVIHCQPTKVYQCFPVLCLAEFGGTHSSTEMQLIDQNTGDIITEERCIAHVLLPEIEGDNNG